ncbi:nitrogenase molybdenum-iron protein subunit beta [Anaerobacillus alkalilacustris]|uniref:Nitrogenase molybdenum-iron protein beta chain n=1 Tax=Anaerobacillus alkalilacustris TaxID=393763 RepID=A0A1S2LYJ6_9BACI|nr:nitrogenase molybdenum-iron protein subunit beta [Anaerobacillus alkalilacustris]OIJ17300.1 nitrogenase molybdenum-iron protein subunit beta [Anaerobacillus alkalilacustris]
MTKKLELKDHNTLFKDQKYIDQAENKKIFETACSTEEVEKIKDYTKTEEYKEKNFARTDLVINPAKACQPLGAVLAGLGFEKTLPFVQGSQGCVSYFRSHFARHFREPVPTVSSSMTEDGAVFGGMRNLIDGLENCTKMYKPEMVAVSTTCMAEVIGDDLQAFIGNARTEGVISEDFPVPFAHTPSFVGSHLTGYDSMLKAILSNLSEKATIDKEVKTEKINIIHGFDTYTGNFAETKRILDLFGADYTYLCDYSENLDSPADGDYKYYYGGTKLEDVPKAAQAQGTLSLQKYSTKKTMKYIEKKWKQSVSVSSTPIGITQTDNLIKTISEMTGLPIPEELKLERGRIVDAMTDSHTYVHGKRVAMAGDPDLLLGLISFCLEVGIEPVHVVCTNGDKKFLEEAETLLASSPYGLDAKVYIGKDLWHLRSLLFTDPVDFVIGSTHMKFNAKDADIPLVRIGFPIFDRHHMHRYPIIGYQGTLNVLTQIVNTLLDNLDKDAAGFNFDVVR